MKKNVMMRVASAMLVLTLLTTCIISGTFAKYTTKGEFQDSARVAKWGVTINIDGDSTFANTYAKDDTTATTITNSVSSIQKVVAPGTANANGAAVTVSGTPEVAFRLSFALAATNDVFLKKGVASTDYTALKKPTSDGSTSYGYTDTFTLAEEYHPIVFTLKKVVGTDETTVATGTLAQVATALETHTEDIAAGTATNVAYKLTWEWAFDGNDKADTLLGNLIASTATGVDAANYSTDVVYTLTVTLNQYGTDASA